MAGLSTGTPQVCPNKKCGANLADPEVPDAYVEYREMFTLARSREDPPVWVCPVCRHEWPRATPSRKMKRQAQKGLRKKMRRSR